MKYMDIIKQICELEDTLGMKATKFGRYSVDRGMYFKRMPVWTDQEFQFKEKPWRYDFVEPQYTSLVNYLMDHHGALFYPARQIGCRHGFKIQFNYEELKERYQVRYGDYIEETTGQLCLAL